MPDQSLNTHADFEERTALAAGGYLPAEEMGAFKEHLLVCEECSRLYEEMVELTLLLQLSSEEIFETPRKK
ncbi:MAG: hypothetical protein PW792_09565 [Acidobacteriaceae bacterium]|nr:hypothetical protein [Acidobacteriaceae bacterium]